MGLMKKLQEINKNTFQDLKLRIGISVGPVIAGIVGNSKPQYDIWVRCCYFFGGKILTLTFYIIL